jgi:hypothetical protein
MADYQLKTGEVLTDDKSPKKVPNTKTGPGKDA